MAGNDQGSVRELIFPTEACMAKRVNTLTADRSDFRAQNDSGKKPADCFDFV